MKQVTNRFENNLLTFPFCLAFLKGNGSMDLLSNLNKITVQVPVFDDQHKPPPKFDPEAPVEEPEEVVVPKNGWTV